jgi:hypothetical protein
MLASGVAIGDQAEAQTVPYILGIAHPTGFPAYILAGWVFSHLVAFGTIAWRLNAFTALITALCACGVFLIAFSLTSEVLGAVLAGIVFAFGAVIWHGALEANAQSLAALCAIATLYASVIAARTGSRRALVAACVCCGIGMAAHPQALWSIPAIVTAALWQRARLDARTIALCFAGIALPLLLYAYLPLRSSYVAAHQLDPTAALQIGGSGHVDWDMNTPRTKAGFLDEVLGRDEHAGESVVRALNPRRSFGALRLWFELVTAQYGWLVPILALAGIAALARVDRRSLSVLLTGCAGSIAFAYLYRTNVNLDRYLILPCNGGAGCGVGTFGAAAHSPRCDRRYGDGRTGIRRRAEHRGQPAGGRCCRQRRRRRAYRRRARLNSRRRDCRRAMERGRGTRLRRHRRRLARHAHHRLRVALGRWSRNAGLATNARGVYLHRSIAARGSAAGLSSVRARAG